MPTKPYVNNGSWQEVKLVYVNNGTWTPARYVYVKIDGVWTRVYPIDKATDTYTTNGSFVVPKTVSKLKITAVGGGGGGGGALLAGCGSVNHSGGSGGGGGAVAIFTVGVTPGQTINFTLGAGGAPGAAYDNRGTFAGEGANSGYNGGDTAVTGSGFSVTAGGGKNGRAPGTGTGENERIGNNCGHSAQAGGVGGTYSLSGVTDAGSYNGSNGDAGNNGGESGAPGGKGGNSLGNGGAAGAAQTGLGGSGNGANYGGGGGGMGGQGGGYGRMTSGFGAGGVVIIEYGNGIN